MIRACLLFCAPRITAFNPWKRRPGGLNLYGRPQMVSPSHFRKGYKKANPDDPTALLKPSHVILKRCRVCKRTKFIKFSEKDHFHTCCEGQPMKVYTNMRDVMNAERRLVDLTRQWDVENDRPRSNPHRPRPKGRSKLSK
ncbi:hypothetical protein AGDE_01247 [Angomonas deanei]|uniref:Uncharacterized protein n=1 Tax=Angomonas deanei TaxID=59799 RepID=S9UIG8_9TRYP|nr:hypothetical protein AGDE_10302 [Angomonas deanei]EPY36038.1 hypothetical protein AGDE_07114 [Angomonas deanei]EPY42116.1 hypothetical protein AGDE_01807 [Angomonas deanei]EPY42676.1 hypothetical protein AGDE_01247 [Angomonas deanei]CAD2222514.1 hypothetical protein, conserved [Angomonas deanei]|eukprot:EPY28748.1 hypothetical protein AGDE_10302 [Angomonas deanei]